VLDASSASLRDRLVVGHIIRTPAKQQPRNFRETLPISVTIRIKSNQRPPTMSVSPPKETDVEQGVPSPDDPDAQMNDPQDPHASGLAYEFEVKEQDRWLPIANG